MVNGPEKYARLAALAEKLTVPNGKITSVEFYPENENVTFLTARFRNTPAHFIIHMVLHSEPGSCIGVTLGLPAENWNGKFLGLGNGGPAGFTQKDDVRRGVTLGYATSHTDMGTTQDPFDCIGNRVALEDFGHRATHLMTVAGKAMTDAFFGKAPIYSYFFGTSTGGQQGLMEAQRYPQDYDGILCFCPAFDRVRLHVQFAWSFKLMNSGERAQLTEEELKAIFDRLVEEYAHRCGGAPGDHFLPYPDQVGEINYAIFRDEKMAVPLNDAQIGILTQIYAGPRDPETGEFIYEGFTPGAETQELGLGSMHDKDAFIKSLLFPFFWAYDREIDLENFDFHKDYQRCILELSPILDATSRDLSAFRNRGGKLLMLHGTADAAIPFANSLRYYKDVVKENGSLDNTLPFFRYFLVPGLAHGLGGPGFQDVGQLDYYVTPEDALHDPLIMLDEWVAQEKAPEMIIATAFENGDVLNPKIEKQRPVYRYPYTTKYVSGDPKRPESFTRDEFGYSGK